MIDLYFNVPKLTKNMLGNRDLYVTGNVPVLGQMQVSETKLKVETLWLNVLFFYFDRLIEQLSSILAIATTNNTCKQIQPV